MQSKTCSKCGKATIVSMCEACVKVAAKIYRGSHKEELKAYREKNKQDGKINLY